MNPWGAGKLGPLDVADYLDFAGIGRVCEVSEVCETQSEILETMDRYYKLAALLKEDSDIDKVGEFIQPTIIQKKSKNLNSIHTLFQNIRKNSSIFVQKSKESRPGNQICIKQEYHDDFFKVLSIIKDTELLDIAKRGGKIHEKTKNDLISALSASPSQESDLIVAEIQRSSVFLENLKKKYLDI